MSVVCSCILWYFSWLSWLHCKGHGLLAPSLCASCAPLSTHEPTGVDFARLIGRRWGVARAAYPTVLL